MNIIIKVYGLVPNNKGLFKKKRVFNKIFLQVEFTKLLVKHKDYDAYIMAIKND